MQVYTVLKVCIYTYAQVHVAKERNYGKGGENVGWNTITNEPGTIYLIITNLYMVLTCQNLPDDVQQRPQIILHLALRFLGPGDSSQKELMNSVRASDFVHEMYQLTSIC